jgi:hypothetical protein
MTSIKNGKTLLVVIAAIAAILAGSTIAIGNGRTALADESITKNVDNTGINVQTHTNQKQQCDTVGGSSPIAGIGFGGRGVGSCNAGSLDRINQTGGELTK